MKGRIKIKLFLPMNGVRSGPGRLVTEFRPGVCAFSRGGSNVGCLQVEPAQATANASAAARLLKRLFETLLEVMIPVADFR